MQTTHVNRLLVIGPTGVGKTTFSKKLASAFFNDGSSDFNPQTHVLSASEWIRNIYPDADRSTLTEKSSFFAKEDPTQGSKYLYDKTRMDTRIKIIEGIRNPYHFTELYSNLDLVIHLCHTTCGVDDYFSDFEQNGIESILSILKWRTHKPLRFSISSSGEDYTDEWVKECRKYLVFV